MYKHGIVRCTPYRHNSEIQIHTKHVIQNTEQREECDDTTDGESGRAERGFFTGDGWMVGMSRWVGTDKTGDTPSLTLTLQESQDIVLSYGSLDVTDDRAAGIVQELYSDLGDTTTRTCNYPLVSLLIMHSQLSWFAIVEEGIVVGRALR